MLEESDILHKSNDKVNNVSLYSLQLKSVNYQVKLLQWHIFIILIVSCIITLVAPSNLIIITSLGMEVYKSPLKFQADCIYTSQDMVFLKSWFSHTFCIVMGNPCPPQYKCMGKP